MHAVRLKKGKETIFQKRHPWIFSGAIAAYPQGYHNGALVAIESWRGELLGWGFFNQSCSLAGRILSFGSEDVYEALTQTLSKAMHIRQALLKSAKTTAFRLVNGEGDGLPGLIVDKYGPYLVIQTGALGMHRLLPFLVDYFTKQLHIEGIYDKSGAKEEGLEAQEKVIWGSVPDCVTILEEGIHFLVEIKTGQKTGFFLDQREMRSFIRTAADQKRVLNCFCYTGGFTLAALKGGAITVDSVDSSAPALSLCQENVRLNGFEVEKAGFYQQDVFDYLRTSQAKYDLVILDPPAFAKKKKDLPNAIKGYKNLFRLAFQTMDPGTLFLCSSCSYYVQEPLFEKIVTEAALEAERIPRFLGKHRNALDHPINPCHPESVYLKSLLVEI